MRAKPSPDVVTVHIGLSDALNWEMAERVLQGRVPKQLRDAFTRYMDDHGITIGHVLADFALEYLRLKAPNVAAAVEKGTWKPS